MDKRGKGAPPLLDSPSTTTVPESLNFPEQLRVWQETLIAVWRVTAEVLWSHASLYGSQLRLRLRCLTPRIQQNPLLAAAIFFSQHYCVLRVKRRATYKETCISLWVSKWLGSSALLWHIFGHLVFSRRLIFTSLLHSLPSNWLAHERRTVVLIWSLFTTLVARCSKQG